MCPGLKKDLRLWFSRKHSVLEDALSRGDNLQLDVLNAVVRDVSFSDFHHAYLPGLTLKCSLRLMSSH